MKDSVFNVAAAALVLALVACQKSEPAPIGQYSCAPMSSNLKAGVVELTIKNGAAGIRSPGHDATYGLLRIDSNGDAIHETAKGGGDFVVFDVAEGTQQLKAESSLLQPAGEHARRGDLWSVGSGVESEGWRCSELK